MNADDDDDDVREKNKKDVCVNNDAIVRMKKIKRIKHEQKNAKRPTAKNKKQLNDWMVQPTLLFHTCVNAHLNATAHPTEPQKRTTKTRNCHADDMREKKMMNEC